ncbi:unnamed protein product, partial [Ectocarpus sp. 12 AP-2014]
MRSCKKVSVGPLRTTATPVHPATRRGEERGTGVGTATAHVSIRPPTSALTLPSLIIIPVAAERRDYPRAHSDFSIGNCTA